jgi:hypothetical protein
MCKMPCQPLAAAREGSCCAAFADLLGTLAICNGLEPNPDGSMSKVDPLADVPRANVARIFKRLQSGREPTDAEDAPDGNRHNAWS